MDPDETEEQVGGAGCAPVLSHGVQHTCWWGEAMHIDVTYEGCWLAQGKSLASAGSLDGLLCLCGIIDAVLALEHNICALHSVCLAPSRHGVQQTPCHSPTRTWRLAPPSQAAQLVVACAYLVRYALSDIKNEAGGTTTGSTASSTEVVVSEGALCMHTWPGRGQAGQSKGGAEDGKGQEQDGGVVAIGLGFLANDLLDVMGSCKVGCQQVGGFMRKALAKAML